MNDPYDPIESVSQPNTFQEWCKDTSVALPEGGDTHMHPVDGGIVVTTRLPDGIDDHDFIPFTS